MGQIAIATRRRWDWNNGLSNGNCLHSRG